MVLVAMKPLVAATGLGGIAQGRLAEVSTATHDHTGLSVEHYQPVYHCTGSQRSLTSLAGGAALTYTNTRTHTHNTTVCDIS